METVFKAESRYIDKNVFYLAKLSTAKVTCGTRMFEMSVATAYHSGQLDNTIKNTHHYNNFFIWRNFRA